MIEVEIRTIVKDPQKAEKTLAEKFLLKKQKHQVDEYFLHPNRDFHGNPALLEYLRIRDEKDKQTFEYHQAHIQNGHKTHSEEFEVKIEDPQKMKEILKQLGFKHWVTVKKTRKVFDCKDFEADLDFVQGLGCFLEIEAKRDFGGIKRTEQKCIEFLESLGIEFVPAPEKGYPDMLAEKNNQPI